MNNDIFRYVTLLLSAECGIGGVLKSLGVPFVGQILSLHQLFILCRARRCCEGRFLGIKISSSVAIFKASISQGKKITPFIALCMQGLLFDLGCGSFLGAFLLSLWAFIQPLAMYYVLFGKTLFLSLKEQINAFGITDAMVYYVLCGIVSLKILVAWFIVCFETKISDAQLAQYGKNVFLKQHASISFQERMKCAFCDLFKWPYLLGLAIVFFSDVSWVYIITTVTCSFCFFLAMRIVPIEKIMRSLFGKEFRQANLLSESRNFHERDSAQT